MLLMTHCCEPSAALSTVSSPVEESVFVESVAFADSAAAETIASTTLSGRPSSSDSSVTMVTKPSSASTFWLNWVNKPANCDLMAFGDRFRIARRCGIITIRHR